MLYALCFSPRRTLEHVVIPLSQPTATISGEPITTLHLTPNTEVHIAISASNRDPAIWGEDADQWKPDRWIGKKVEDVATQRLPGIYSGM